jgi:branched-chain amino acid transport system permease protein
VVSSSHERYFALRGVVPFAVAIHVLLLADHLVAQQYVLDVLFKIGFAIILAVSLNIVNGLTGQFSLGHAGFMAVGAFLGSLLSLQHRQAHLDAAAGATNALAALVPSHFASTPGSIDTAVVFVIATLLGGAAAAFAGLLVGLPSLRLRGDYLAIVTLGFGEIIRVVIENTPALGRATGLVNIPRATNLFWVYGWAFATILVARRLAASTHGRALLAIREDEVAAEAMGVDTTGYKVRAFVLSSFFAGVAGSLMGHYQQSIQPASFTFVKSIDVVVMVTLGGLGSTSGSILAAIVLTLTPELLRSIDQYRPVLYSELLIALMLVRPTGLFGTREFWEVAPEMWARWKRGKDNEAPTPAKRHRPISVTGFAVALALGAVSAVVWGVAFAGNERAIALVAAGGCAATAAGLWTMRAWGRGVAFAWAFVLLNAGAIAAFEFTRDAPAGAAVGVGTMLRLLPSFAAVGLLVLTSRFKTEFER